MSNQETTLTLRLTTEERGLLLEAVRNQRGFVIEDGYKPEFVDKFVTLAVKVERAAGGENR